MRKKILSVIICLALAISIIPAVKVQAAGLTQTQIQAVLSLLQAFGADASTISNVQTALSGGTPATPAPAWCHTFNANLGYANSGTNEVANLHAVLQKEGISYGSDGTNIYSEDTMTAVIQLQAKYGIVQTGYFGSATRTKINSLYGCGTVTTCTPNWTCGWGACANGYQSQVATDSNNCGLSSSSANIACPALARACNTSNSITINSVSGPNSLNVGQTGTWQVNATAPSGSTLTYSVDWGDTVYYPMASGSANVNQISTFTHSYSQAGTYTVKFTVSNQPVCMTAPGSGQMFPCLQANSAASSITVVVGSQSSPLITSVINPTSDNNKMIVYGANLSNLQSLGQVYIDSVLFNTGIDGVKDGSSLFFIPPTFSIGQHTIYVKTDVGTSNIFAFTISSTTQPSITSISPTSGPVGTTVTVYGSGFNSSQRVYFTDALGGGSNPTSSNTNANVSPSTISTDGAMMTFVVPNLSYTGNYTIAASPNGGPASNWKPFTVTQSSGSLTQSQIQSIISLMQSFGANASAISNVQSALTGGTPATPVPASGLTQTQTQAIISLLQSWGASSSIISNVQLALSGAQPSITVTSPNGGNYGYGQQMLIQWTSQGISAGSLMYIDLIKTDNYGNQRQIQITQPGPNNGSAYWTVSATSPQNEPIDVGAYKVAVINSDNNVVGMSAQFNIASSVSTQPAITSISPTSGPAGTLATVTGSNLNGATFLWVNSSEGEGAGGPQNFISISADGTQATFRFQAGYNGIHVGTNNIFNKTSASFVYFTVTGATGASALDAFINALQSMTTK